jgi:hypothetical protein
MQIKMQLGFNYSHKLEFWSLHGICKDMWHMAIYFNKPLHVYIDAYHPLFPSFKKFTYGTK